MRFLVVLPFIEDQNICFDATPDICFGGPADIDRFHCIDDLRRIAKNQRPSAAAG